MNLLRDEKGETMVELLITIIFISIGFVAVVASMGSSIIASDTHRSMADSDVIIRHFGEAIKDKASSVTVLCPDAGDLTPTYTVGGWTLTISDVDWWIKGAGFTDGHWAENRSECTDAVAAACPVIQEPKCDPGLQRVFIEAQNDRTDYAAQTAQTWVFVRRGNPTP